MKDLMIIGSELEVANNLVNQTGQELVEAYWNLGRLLQEAKLVVPHGQYRDFHLKHGISKDRAARALKLFKRHPEMSQIATFETMSDALFTKPALEESISDTNFKEAKSEVGAWISAFCDDPLNTPAPYTWNTHPDEWEDNELNGSFHRLMTYLSWKTFDKYITGLEIAFGADNDGSGSISDIPKIILLRFYLCIQDPLLNGLNIDEMTDFMSLKWFDSDLFTQKPGDGYHQYNCPPDEYVYPPIRPVGWEKIEGTPPRAWVKFGRLESPHEVFVRDIYVPTVLGWYKNGWTNEQVRQNTMNC